MRVIPGQLGRGAECLVNLPREIGGVNEVHVRGNVEIVDDPGSVRQREHVLNLQSHRVHPTGRNDLVGERSTYLEPIDYARGVGIKNLTIGESLAGAVDGRCTALRQRNRIRVALVGSRVEIEAAAGGEVAAPVSLRGHRLEPVGDQPVFPVLLEVEKEEALVLAVVNLRNLDRAAEGKSEIVAPLDVADVLALAIRAYRARVGEG